MTAEEFKKIFYTQGTIDGRGEIIEGLITISDSRFFNQTKSFVGERTISNFVFKNNFRIEKLELDDGISFWNCRFEGSLYISNVSKLESENEAYAKIGLSGCNVESLSFGHCLNLDEISVNYNTKIDRLTIHNCAKIAAIMIIGNNELLSVHSFRNKNKELFVANNNSSERFTFKNEKYEKVTVRGNSIKYFVEIENIEVEQLEIEDNLFEKLSISEKIEIIDLKIVGNTASNELKIDIGDESNIAKFVTSLGKYGQGFLIRGKTKNHKVGSFTLDSNESTHGPYSFYNLNIHQFALTGLVQNTSILLDNNCINSLLFRNHINRGVITITNLNSDLSSLSEVEIINSSLGEVEIRNVDFSKCNIFTITSSSLVEVQSSGVKWFSSEMLNSLALGSTLKHAENREVYRQLKQAMYSQGDTIQALKFKSLEMEAFHEQIKYEKPLRELTSIKDMGDRLSIYLNRASNKNGLDWTRPIGLLLGATFFTYFFVVIHGSCQLGWTPARSCEELMTTLTTLSDNFGIYFRLMDPTLKLSEVVDTYDGFRIGRLLTVIYFVYKIVLAYLIFQTIAAFRKYLK